MFLHWNFFVLTLFLSAFRALLVSALGAGLAIYSRFRGPYGNSIRWVYQGGILEMVKSLYYAPSIVPPTTIAALSFVVVASFVASNLDTVATQFIKPSTSLSHPFSESIASKQFSLPGVYSAFSGWSTSIQHGANIVDGIKRMINNTNIIPQYRGGQIYVPRTFDYDVECNQMDVYILDHTVSNLFLSNGGCAAARIVYTASINVNSSDARVTKLSDGRWTVRARGYARLPATETRTIAITSMQDRLCGTPGSSSVSMRGIVTGISSFPRTIITKCLLPTGKVRVVSETSTRFSMTSYKLFPNAILKAFREPDELMQAMGSSIRNTTFPNSTFFVDPSFYADSVLLSEVRVRNSTVDVIACNSYSTAFYNVSSIAMTCIYTTVETLFLKPQEINPAITTALRGKPLPMYHNVSLSMAITHIVAKDESGVGPIGISTLQNATASAARYMASLGQNFLEDYDEGVLYVIYDVVDTLAGFDIPDWLMGCMFAAMVFCLCFWALTEYFLDVLYTGSLYRVISARFIPSPTSGTPIIMRSNVKPLTIETIPVLPADDIYPMDVVPSTVSLPQTL